MASLLLVIFLLRLMVHIITVAGAAGISDLLWAIYTKLPTDMSKRVREQRILRGEVVNLKREMNGISAQDEFSKWAKVRRKFEAAQSKEEKIASSIGVSKSAFTSSVSVFRMVFKMGAPFVVSFWYRKSPLFWLPHGWFPGYVEWFLALPGAPAGSIGLNVWSMACSSIITIMWDASTAAFALRAKAA